MRGGFRGRQGLLGLGRGRPEGWQRGGESGRGGLIGSGIGPLNLITGAKKLLQDVSRLHSNKRIMLNSSQDVLYLMIVQKPTEAQMAEAMACMNSGQARY